MAWKCFLDHFNSTPILLKINLTADADLKLFSDASCKGFVAVFGNKWLMGQFPDFWLGKSNAYLFSVHAMGQIFG